MPFDWEPTDENVEKCTELEAKFIFEQSEKMLKEINDGNVLLTNRTITLLSFAVAFMLALVGFLFNRRSVIKTGFDAEIAACVISIGYIMYVCRMLMENIKGNDEEVVGAEPQKLFKDTFFNNKELKDNEKMKYLFINEIVVCQAKITRNLQSNHKKWQLYNKALWRLLYTPIVIALIFLLLKLLMFFYYLIFCCQAPS